MKCQVTNGATTTVKSRPFFLLFQGKGEETIILIHGFPTSTFDYARAIDHLSQHYRQHTI